jgi:hypothetical protein
MKLMHLGGIKPIFKPTSRATQFTNLQATGFGFSIKLTADLFIIRMPYKNFQ